MPRSAPRSVAAVPSKPLARSTREALISNRLGQSPRRRFQKQPKQRPDHKEDKAGAEAGRYYTRPTDVHAQSSRSPDSLSRAAKVISRRLICRMRVTFIGLGAIGWPMAMHLAQRHATVYNRTTARATDFARRYPARVADTPRQAADGSDVVVTCLPTSREVEALLDGANGLLAGLRRGALLLDCTSGDPASLGASPSGWRRRDCVCRCPREWRDQRRRGRNAHGDGGSR